MKVVAVEPPSGELVQGLRNLDDGFVPPIFEPDVLDRKFIVRPRESVEFTRRLLERVRRVRGHLVGRRGRRRGEDGDDDGGGHDRRAAARRRLEVPVVRARGPTRSTRSSSAPPASTTGDAERRTHAEHRSCGRGAAARRAGRVPDRDRLRARRRRRERRRAAPPVPREAPTRRPSRDRAHRGAAPTSTSTRATSPTSRARAGARRSGPGRSRSSCASGRTASPSAATGGRDTVGLRVPDHPVALALLDAFGGGLAAPSANRFGRVSPTTAAHVRADLGDDVDLVLDGGPCRVGVESTIVDVTRPEPAILRVGGVGAADVARVAGAPLARRDTGRGRGAGHACRRTTRRTRASRSSTPTSSSTARAHRCSHAGRGSACSRSTVPDGRAGRRRGARRRRRRRRVRPRALRPLARSRRARTRRRARGRRRRRTASVLAVRRPLAAGVRRCVAPQR